MIQSGGGFEAVSFARSVVEVVGDLMAPLDIYPQRFRVSELPTEEQLAAMGAEAV